MLAGGVLSPMLEVEVRVTKLTQPCWARPSVSRQSLYYRSKTCLRCSDADPHGPAGDDGGGVLVILFSVVFHA